MSITNTSDVKKIDRTTPFSAQLVQRELLTKAGSSKETYHLTLDITNSGLSFKVGDSVGIYGQNNPNLVDKILHTLSARGDESIIDPKSTFPLSIRTFLTQKANLSRVNGTFLQLLSTKNISSAGRTQLDRLLELGQEESLKLFTQVHEPLDLLQLCSPEDLSLQEFCNQLSPLLPRFYSIASSLRHSPERIDLTVALSSYQYRNELRFGVASYFLCKLAQEKSTPIPLYIQATPHFTIPTDPNIPIIMIGPGTGIAPFRGFIQERIATSSSGKNWLFFGERNRITDFFYEEFWLQLEKQGVLHLDVAFSRDQIEKIYVQDVLRKKQASLWEWVQEGAVIYVCGDAENMAKAVEAAWLDIFQNQGHMTLEEAKTYLRLMKKEKRYRADVY